MRIKAICISNSEINVPIGNRDKTTYQFLLDPRISWGLVNWNLSYTLI